MSAFAKLRDLLEMIRFSHTVFALPFALLAAVMAWSAPGIDGGQVRFQPWHVVGILICMVGARSAAMAFNRLVDRDLDAKNPRTAQRHIPSGRISTANAILFVVLASLLFGGGTLLFLPNWLPLALALPVLAILLAYSYTKRFTSLAHFWLGASLMLAPVAAWIAIRGDRVLQNPMDLVPAGILGAAVLFWVAGFDIIYACQDYEFDQQNDLRSFPVRWGIPGALRWAAVCHGGMIVALLSLPGLSSLAGVETGLGWLYVLTVLAVLVLLTYEHAIVSADDLTRVNVAFFNVNAVVSFSLFGLATLDLLAI